MSYFSSISRLQSTKFAHVTSSNDRASSHQLQTWHASVDAESYLYASPFNYRIPNGGPSGAFQRVRTKVSISTVRFPSNSLKIAKSFVTEAMDFYRQVPRFHPPFLHQTYHLTFGLELFQSRLLSTPRNPGSTARPLVGSPVSVGEGETSSSRRIAPIATLSDL